MNLQLAQIDLGDLGSLHTYDMSGQEGVLLHEFAPLHGNAGRVAIFIGEGVDLAENLRFAPGPGGEGAEPGWQRYHRNFYNDELFSIRTVALSDAGGMARLAFSGGRPVGLHVLVVDRTAGAFKDLAKRARKKILEPIFAKFKDKCWLCMRLVRALCSALIGGMDVDTEDVVEILKKIFPEDWIPDLPDTDLGDLLKRILDFLRKHDPRNVIARALCEQLGYCQPPAGQGAGSTPPDGRLVQFQYLISVGVTDPDVAFWVAVLTDDHAGITKALSQGANVNVTDSAVLQRHREALRGMPRP
jgi:hypothetical protein